VVSAAVCAGLALRGERVAALKPALTGLDEEPGEWPHDHELLASVASAGQAPEAVAPNRFGPPLSPHLAAKLAGVGIEPAALLAAADRAAAHADAIVVEGVGGLMVPLTPGYLVRDLAIDLAMPVVVAARTGLGTINHTLLTLDAARSAGLRVVGVAMTPWPLEPSTMERSNCDTVERLGGIEVSRLQAARPGTLADAAEALPLERWLDGSSGGVSSAAPRRDVAAR
jgi:dethiobiotin synthetase